MATPAKPVANPSRTWTGITSHHEVPKAAKPPRRITIARARTRTPPWLRLRAIGAAKFARLDYEVAYSAVQRKMNLNLTVDDSLALLYQYSILGFQRAVTSAGITFQFRYKDAAVTFEPEAPFFLVHRGLKETLGLTETLQDG